MTMPLPSPPLFLSVLHPHQASFCSLDFNLTFSFSSLGLATTFFLEDYIHPCLGTSCLSSKDQLKHHYFGKIFLDPPARPGFPHFSSLRKFQILCLVDDYLMPFSCHQTVSSMRPRLGQFLPTIVSLRGCHILSGIL